MSTPTPETTPETTPKTTLQTIPLQTIPLGPKQSIMADNQASFTAAANGNKGADQRSKGGALAFSELKGGQHQDYQHEAPTMGGRRRRQNSKKRRGGSKKRHNNSKRRGHNNSKRRGHNNSKRQRGGK